MVNSSNCDLRRHFGTSQSLLHLLLTVATPTDATSVSTVVSIRPNSPTVATIRPVAMIRPPHLPTVARQLGTHNVPQTPTLCSLTIPPNPLATQYLLRVAGLKRTLKRRTTLGPIQGIPCLTGSLKSTPTCSPRTPSFVQLPAIISARYAH